MHSVHFLFLVTFLSPSAAVFAQDGCPSTGSLRLLPTATITASNAGRVEICLPRSVINSTLVWGTIASFGDNTWSEKNGNVACRELGFDGALNSILINLVPRVDTQFSPTVVHLQDVNCNGFESRISECISRSCCSELELDVSGNSDVFIVCRPRSPDSYSELHTGIREEGDIRLVGSPTDGSGIVEVYDPLNGWVTICPDNEWFGTNVDVLCDQLGYETGTPNSFVAFPSAVGDRRFYAADCSSASSSFSRRRVGVCSYEEEFPNSGNCVASSTSFAGVQCLISSGAGEGSVRLVGGADVAQGIVEILINDRWGVICGENWDSFGSIFNDRVVCEELGFDADDASYISSTGLVSSLSALKPLWLHSVSCTSASTTLQDCPRGFPTGYATCRTSDDLAAVDCGDPPSSGLSSGSITGIVFAIFGVVFFIVPFGYIWLKGYWANRHDYGWYNKLTTPSEWCDCCECDCTRPTRQTWQPPTQTAPVLQNVVVTSAATNDSEDETSSNYVPPIIRQSEPHPPTQTEDQELTKVAPPTYNDAATFASPKPDDLPPPYPGGPSNFAYPPPTVSSAATAPAPYQGYPPPTNPNSEPPAVVVQPTAPPAAAPYPSSTTLDPAYPPPPSHSVAEEPALPYPTEPSTDPAYPPAAVPQFPDQSSEQTSLPYPSSESSAPYPPEGAVPYPPEP